MSQRIVREEGTFAAVGDDGKAYSVILYQEYIRSKSGTVPVTETKGYRRLATVDGLGLNYVEKGVYRVIRTGVTLRVESPDAP